MNPPPTAMALDADQRERLGRMADVLMPAGAGLPAASELDIQHDWIDQALAAVPMMAPALQIALQIPGDPATAVEALRQQQPAVFMAFTFVLSGAYFLHPRVRQELGYESLAVQPHPPLEGEAEYYLDDDLLTPVIARGAIFRPVPTEG